MELKIEMERIQIQHAQYLRIAHYVEHQTFILSIHGFSLSLGQVLSKKSPLRSIKLTPF